MKPAISLLVALGALVACNTVRAGLVPPPGFRAPVQHQESGGKPCPEAVAPYTGALEFPSKYEGSDAARDDLNEKAYAKYKQLIAPINDTEKQVSALVGAYLRTGRPETLDCALDWLAAWSQAGALLAATSDHTGKAVRKWALASLASAYLRLKFSPSQPLREEPRKARQIESWLAELGRLVVEDWRDAPLAKMNNHEYWAAWAVMATAVAVDRRDLFDWAVAQYRIAASQVDAEGYLPNELKRETRALAYHNYSMGPLTMIAVFARSNGTDLSGAGNHALQRLAGRVLAGMDDPKSFRERTGRKQNLEDVREPSKLAWLEPYCAMVACSGDLARRVDALRPLKTYRLGGNLTELFGPPDAAHKDTRVPRDPDDRSFSHGGMLTWTSDEHRFTRRCSAPGAATKPSRWASASRSS